MKPDEVVVGGYYVMQGGVIRHFYGLTPSGKARYRAYDMQSGDYIHTCACDVDLLVWRSERRATPEEVSRLHEWKESIEIQRNSLGKALRRTTDRRW